MPAIFTQPTTGGSIADKINQARNFLQSGGVQPQAADAAGAVEPGAVAGAAAEATQFVQQPGAMAVVSGSDPDGLAAAARAAAESAIVNPAYNQIAGQGQQVIVVPRVIAQAPGDPIMVPVDIAIPRPQMAVSIAPAEAVMVDGATGQMIASSAPQPAAQAAAIAETVADATPAAASSPSQGFRSWGVADLAQRFGGGRVSGAPAQVAGEAVQVAGEAAAPARTSLIDQLRSAATAAYGSASAPAAVASESGAVASAVVDAPAQKLGDRLLASLQSRGGGASEGAGLLARLTGAADGAAAPVVSEAVELAGSGAASLGARLLEAAQLASRVSPKG